MRETGTGQQVGQLHDRHTMMMMMVMILLSGFNKAWISLIEFSKKIPPPPQKRSNFTKTRPLGVMRFSIHVHGRTDMADFCDFATEDNVTRDTKCAVKKDSVKHLFYHCVTFSWVVKAAGA